LRNPKKKNSNLTKLFSCKSFRILKKDNSDCFEVSISKKYFKLAVDRNKIKRRIKEIIRKNGYSGFLSNGFVFSVFRPFAELSYENANKEIQKAIEEIKKIS
jgi:ribonuclease P protein component